MYLHRTYRKHDTNQRLAAFEIAVEESDLYIKADTTLKEEALHLVKEARTIITGHIQADPAFKASLVPLPVDEAAHPLVKEMLRAAVQAGVGPMAGVAGAIAEWVGRGLLAFSSEVIVENGGDIFLHTRQPVIVDIFAGPSPLSQKIGLKLEPARMPLGVCTSSGTVGPSLSFGKADAVTMVAPSAALADTMATAVANTIKTEHDIRPGLDLARTHPGVLAAVIILKDKMGAWGKVEIVRI